MKPTTVVTKQQTKALEELMRQHHGKLDPEVVVEAARDPKSPPHSLFEWDDGAAAAAYRIRRSVG